MQALPGAIELPRQHGGLPVPLRDKIARNVPNRNGRGGKGGCAPRQQAEGKGGRGQNRRSRPTFLWNLQQRMLFMHDFPTPDVWLAHRVSYGETDTMGYLYYAEYLHLFERSRSEYIREMGMSYAEVERLGIMLPVREAQCRYRRPARYDDLIHIRAGIAEVRRASLVFVYNVMDAERKTLLAEGMTEHACTGRDGRPVRPPEWFVRLMRGEPFQIPE